MSRFNFKDTETAFSHLSNFALDRAKLLFTILSKPNMVKLGKWGSNFATKIHLPIGWALKPTIYAHFVGGETLEDCLEPLHLLKKRGVTAVMDYSAEGGEDDEDIKATYEETVRSFEFAAKHRDLISHAVFKVSGLAPVEVLVRYLEQPETLTEDEKQKVEELRERFMNLCELARDLDIRVLVDAEHYAYQQIIDDLTEEAIVKYNKDKCIVFATLQMYRHDRLAYLEHLKQLALENNLKVGVKFVRGAYMEEERERAQEKGYPDPICKDKEATDKNYNDALRYAVENLEHFEMFCGTHNETSNQVLADLMEEKGLANDDPRIYFAQLYGMSDNISFQLSKHGYNISKYLPYAPVDKVLPYLIRRAEENTAIAGQTTRELSLINKEVNRRRREIARKNKK